VVARRQNRYRQVTLWQYFCLFRALMPATTSVLIVDDEPAIRELMARWVHSLGLQPRTAASSEEAIVSLSARHCDLAVIDVMMPGKNGLWLAGEVRRDHPHTAVVLATGYSELIDGASPSVADLLIKPIKRERFVLALDRGIEWRRQAIEELEWHARLSTELGERVEQIRGELAAARARGADEAALLVALATERTPDVSAHAERVVRYSMSIAAEMRLAMALLPEIERGARFHDIGKVATPEPILSKPSPLTPSEVAIMRRHVEAGAEILEGSETLRDLSPIVRASHEWFSGGGYPEKLAGDAIPLASRIIGVADAYDAMTQDRLYRRRLDSAEAIAELLRCAPAQFDPNVIVAFLNILSKH
jgi:putative nucleotidyltransferase with HDIG domain